MRDSTSPRRPRSAAFTLIELIVVITIIGILGTLVVVHVSGITPRAIEVKTRHDLKVILGAAGIFQASYGRYPESLEELKGATVGGKPVEPLLRETLDFWNNEYIYELTADGSPRARCLGKDGVEGGEGENKDYEEPAPRNA